MLNRFWIKLPEAEGDMQTDGDSAKSERSSRDRIARVDKNNEDKEEDN